MLSLIRNLVKRCIVTNAGTDDGQYAIQQVTYNGRVGDCDIVFPYGMHANLPNDSLLVMFNVNAVEQNRAAIGGLPQERIKNLPQGEIVFFHPITKSRIHFKNNGDIDIDVENAGSPENMTISLRNLTITATENVTINNTQTNITSTDSVNVDAPITNLGVGGGPIARTGDAVEVTVTSGSSAGVYGGTITGGGVNTSI